MRMKNLSPCFGVSPHEIAEVFIVGIDRDAEDGMATLVRRLRACSVLDYKFVLLGHNTIRGAAGGTLLNAELLYAKGFLK